MINKLLKRVLLIVLLISSGIFIPDFTIMVNASSHSYDKKIYCEITDDIEFETDSIIVIMDKSLSEKNKIHSLEFFGIDLFEEISDLTYGDINILGDDFEQILELKLRKKNREGVLEAIRFLEEIQGIKYVGPNKIYGFNQSSNDTYYVGNDLWGIDDMQVPDVWDYSTGSSEIRVGVIDSGIASHPDLNANVTTGFDFVSGNSITNDDIVGHGTHVAGIIGAVGNNNIGVSGVNWDVTIVPLQVSKSMGGVSDSACVQAVNHATETFKTDNAIKILNFSINGYLEWPEMETAIRQYPGLFVCAAGNDGKNIDQKYSYPAFYGTSLHDSPLSNIFVVGAIDENDERSIWSIFRSSNYGTDTVDIYAPGSNIVSTYPESLYDSSDTNHISSGYFNTGGTSMATPYVVGVAALLLSVEPELTPAQLKYAIINSSETILISIPGGTKEEVKKVNAFSALKYVMSGNVSFLQLGYANKYIEKSIDGTSPYFIENNAMIRLDVQSAYNYSFTITATNPINVTLYDYDLKVLSFSPSYSNGNCKVEFSQYLALGGYYLKINYVDKTHSGTIDVTIYGPPHQHSYTGWVYNDRISHIEVCDCGSTGTLTESHMISQADIFKPRAKCLGCHTMLDMRGNGDVGMVPDIMSTNINIVTENGSYILPNGIIVLVEEDIEAYLDGTLIFYDEDEILITKKKFKEFVYEYDDTIYKSKYEFMGIENLIY